VLSDSFHRQYVQRSAGLLCKREDYAFFSLPAYQGSISYFKIGTRDRGEWSDESPWLRVDRAKSSSLTAADHASKDLR
jgi:hypothetical protein